MPGIIVTIFHTFNYTLRYNIYDEVLNSIDWQMIIYKYFKTSINGNIGHSINKELKNMKCLLAVDK